DACVEIDQNCQDVLNEHFGADDIEDPQLKAIYLQGMRWFARWNVDAADIPQADRAPGDGTTQRLYNYIAYKIDRSTDEIQDGSVIRLRVKHDSAYVWTGLYADGMPGADNPTTGGNVPAYIMYDLLFPDKDVMIDVFTSAFDACEEGEPSELTSCFTWWGWSHHYDYSNRGW
ncbi:MAG: hypothetical protein GXP62_14280, partial [Oligoflexia bacterium]|nr:hypothetical protein [Oligoflexia bacterium]